jgi:DNA-binding MarR family transcriptional regulator
LGDFNIKKQFPHNFAIFTLARSHRALASQLLRDAGLFVGQEIMLMQLWEQDGQSQQSLGRMQGLDHSTIAKSVRRLEESGWVSRSRSEKDGRITIVSLTQAGRELMTEVIKAWNVLESETIADLTKQEKELLLKLSGKIVSNIENSLLSR